MNYDHYNERAESVRKSPFLFLSLKLLNQIFTLIAFILYPVLIFSLFLRQDSRTIFYYILIPALSFFAVSFWRKKINAQRPYETYPITPLISKKKRGESFPSRHVFCIFLIGILWTSFSFITGLILLVCGLGLAFLRVIGGVHFFNDVFWGAFFGVICGLLTILIA